MQKCHILEEFESFKVYNYNNLKLKLQQKTQEIEILQGALESHMSTIEHFSTTTEACPLTNKKLQGLFYKIDSLNQTMKRSEDSEFAAEFLDLDAT